MEPQRFLCLQSTSPKRFTPQPSTKKLPCEDPSLCKNFVKEISFAFRRSFQKLELRKALAGDAIAKLSPKELISEKGQWFGFDSSLDSLVEARDNINSEIQKLLAPMPRRERRKIQSDLDLKKRRSHQKWRELIGSASATDQFPANILGSEATIDWFLNEISDQQYRERTLAVMHNPHLMFKYVVDETKNRKQLYEIIRNQGSATLADLERSTESMKPALSAIAFSEVQIDLNELINRLCLQPSFLRRTISAYTDTSCAHIYECKSPAGFRTCLECCTQQVIGKPTSLKNA